MRNRIDPDGALLSLAVAQEGMVTREQALAHGMSVESIRRLLTRGWWQRPAPGLYHCQAGNPSWLGLAWGGVLLGGDRSRLGGEAAAHLHGLLGSPPDVITVLLPHGTRRVPRGPWQFVQESEGLRRRSRGAPPRIDVEDCTLDLCEDRDPVRINDLVSRAVQTRRTTPDRLRRRLDARSRHSQRALLHSLLADVGSGAESPLELMYLERVERAHGLPHGSRQHRRRGTARDVYYDEYATIVELDGQPGHQGAGRHRDMRRDNRSTLAGESTLRYGWWDVLERPCLVAAEVAEVLRQRGWHGCLVLCPTCDSARRSE